MSDEELAETVKTELEAEESADGADAGGEDAPAFDSAKSGPDDRETAGPFDLSEVPTIRPYIDLGGIKVAPREGLQMRLEVDERAQRVVAASIEYRDSLLQVQAFSAPKSRGLWHEIRAQLVEQLDEQGAESRVEEGPLGPELVTASVVPAEQGGGSRVVRFIGVDGPRWILRGVILGEAAEDDAARETVLEIFREIVVVRGEAPMPPGELIAMHVPAGVDVGGRGGVSEA